MTGRCIPKSFVLFFFFFLWASKQYLELIESFSSYSAYCMSPGSPHNGTTHGSNFHHNKRISFSCLPGFMLIGHSTAVCINGKWSASVPRCIGTMLCEPETWLSSPSPNLLRLRCLEHVILTDKNSSQSKQKTYFGTTAIATASSVATPRTSHVKKRIYISTSPLIRLLITLLIRVRNWPALCKKLHL